MSDLPIRFSDRITSECKVMQLGPSLGKPLSEFFIALSNAGYERSFHPHPLTRDEATRLASYQGQDYFAVLMADEEILAYGMLRGWDDGYAVPSLGIATNPAYRGRGAGKQMMLHLHEVARQRGSAEVRLTVNEGNTVAIALYLSLGYTLEKMDAERLVGRLIL